MFESISLETLGNILQWTSIAVGAIGGLTILSYVVPFLRKPAIAIAVVFGVGWICLLYGNHAGRADVQSQWDAAKIEAEAARMKRDAEITKQLDDKYKPQIAEARKLADDRKRTVDHYERVMLPKLAKGSFCPLGAGPLRLRNERR